MIESGTLSLSKCGRARELFFLCLKKSDETHTFVADPYKDSIPTKKPTDVNQ